MNIKKEANSNGSIQQSLLTYWAIASVPLVMVLGNSMLIPILPQLQKKLHVSSFQSSLVITLFSVTAAIFIPIVGYLSDRYSRKSIMIPSLLLFGSAGILAGFAAVWGSYPILIAARALQGFGAAGTAPIAMALVGDLYKDGTESKVLGLTEAANGAGKVISPILGSLLALIVWYSPFFAFPVCCAISLAALIFIVKEPKQQKQAVPLPDYLKKVKALFTQKGHWLIPAFFTGALALFILFGVLFYLSNILEQKPHHIKGVWKGMVLSIPLLGLVVTSYTTGSRINKNGTIMRRLMLIGLFLIGSMLVLSIFLFQQLYLFIALMTLSSIGTGLVLPCLNTMITGSVERSERGMITSLYSCLRFFGVAAGPPLFGWMMNISHQLIFITVSILAVIIFGIVFFLIKPPETVA